MTLSLVRMELARNEGYPEGSRRHGYEFVAPLTEAGRIDSDAWLSNKEKCTVRRFWGDEETQTGRLKHVGQGWRFDYNAADTSDDEPFFKLDKHKIAQGEYVSITEQDGVQRTFRIVSVTPVRKAQAR